MEKNIRLLLCKASKMLIQRLKKDMTRAKRYQASNDISPWTQTNGLPHAMDVPIANVTDRDRAIGMVESNEKYLKGVLKALVDGEYSGENFTIAIKAIIGAKVEVVKRSEVHTFKVIPNSSLGG